jgi:predicted O-linked N-acetylglucosamine transferase (SPINDLY family)
MPDSIEQLIEQADTQIAAHHLDAAAHSYRLALVQEPSNPECLLRLSCVLMQMKCHAESLHYARHFLRKVDDVAFAYFLAGYTAREIGRWEESRSYLLRAVELDSSHLYARVLCCMTSFTVCRDEVEALSILRSYAVELDRIIRDTGLDTVELIHAAVDGIGAHSPFFLPYLGYDVTWLQAKYGSWVCSVMATRYPQFIKPLPRNSSGGRMKIGIVSNYFHKHSHWKIAIKGWIEQLDRQRFSIHCFHTGEIIDGITEYAKSVADSFLQSNDIDRVIASMLELQPDVLIHSGIGMDTHTLKLAGLRLAPVQCTSWGHPLTTGMPTIDYFLSSNLMEPPNGENHYTEKLICLPNLSIYCEPVEPVDKSFPEFDISGVRQDDIIFLCCQNLMKYLPQNDHVFPGIARHVINARFVFIESSISELTKRFTRRLELAFQRMGLASTDHITFVPPLNDTDYAALNLKADIYLDSIGWSGGNTTLESLPYNKPIVTFPGEFMRGRHSYAILKMMGIEETIAANAEEYISISVRLANDPVWRQAVSDSIRLNKHKIYRDEDCIKGLEQFFVQACARASRDVYADT